MTETIATLLMGLWLGSTDAPALPADLVYFPDRAAVEAVVERYRLHLDECRRCRATYPIGSDGWKRLSEYINQAYGDCLAWEYLECAIMFRDGYDVDCEEWQIHVDPDPAQAAYYLDKLRECIGPARYYQGIMPAPPPSRS